MHIKTFAPITVLSSIHYTTFDQLHSFGPVMAELYAEAGRKGVINGPLHWIYYDLDAHENGLITLEIALPVKKRITSKKFNIRQLAPFKAITFPVEGPWEHQHIKQHRSHECRELFLNIDFEHPEKNLTEIQIGLGAITEETMTYEQTLVV